MSNKRAVWTGYLLCKQFSCDPEVSQIVKETSSRPTSNYLILETNKQTIHIFKLNFNLDPIVLCYVKMCWHNFRQKKKLIVWKKYMKRFKMWTNRWMSRHNKTWSFNHASEHLCITFHKLLIYFFAHPNIIFGYIFGTWRF